MFHCAVLAGGKTNSESLADGRQSTEKFLHADVNDRSVIFFLATIWLRCVLCIFMNESAEFPSFVSADTHSLIHSVFFSHSFCDQLESIPKWLRSIFRHTHRIGANAGCQSNIRQLMSGVSHKDHRGDRFVSNFFHVLGRKHAQRRWRKSGYSTRITASRWEEMFTITVRSTVR